VKEVKQNTKAYIMADNAGKREVLQCRRYQKMCNCEANFKLTATELVEETTNCAVVQTFSATKVKMRKIPSIKHVASSSTCYFFA
jgi:hypothetical protein